MPPGSDFQPPWRPFSATLTPETSKKTCGKNVEVGFPNEVEFGVVDSCRVQGLGVAL